MPSHREVKVVTQILATSPILSNSANFYITRMASDKTCSSCVMLYLQAHDSKLIFIKIKT